MSRLIDKALSWHRLRASFIYALRGIKRFFSHTPNAFIHMVATISVIVAAILLQVSRVEWAMLIICIVLVLSLEALNSALEKLSDQVTKEYSPLIRDAKDMAAGAVLIAAIGSAIIGLIIFVPYLF